MVKASLATPTRHEEVGRVFFLSREILAGCPQDEGEEGLIVSTGAPDGSFLEAGILGAGRHLMVFFLCFAETL